MTTAAPTARICPECATSFEVVKKQGKARVFCSDACKQVHANRRTARGKSLVAIAQGWRQSRGSGDFGKFLFAEMTAMLDQMNAEDLAAGRMKAVDYAKTVTEFRPVSLEYNTKAYEASRFMDRQTRR